MGYLTNQRPPKGMFHNWCGIVPIFLYEIKDKSVAEKGERKCPKNYPFKRDNFFGKKDRLI
jgi:hypothetical protein